MAEMYIVFHDLLSETKQWGKGTPTTSINPQLNLWKSPNPTFTDPLENGSMGGNYGGNYGNYVLTVTP